MPPRSTTCLITIDMALALRQVGVDPAKGIFKCPECGAPVRPHGRDVTAHFEHLKRDPGCSLSGGRRMVTGEARR